MSNTILVREVEQNNIYRCSLCDGLVTTEGRVLLNVITSNYFVGTYVNMQAAICKKCFDIMNLSFTSEK